MQATGINIAQDLYPESASIRARVLDSWLLAPPLSSYTQDSQFIVNESGIQFALTSSINAQNETFELRLSPLQTESIRGTWVLTRNLRDGSPRSIKIFPTNDSSIYILFTPLQNNFTSSKTLVDVYGYNFAFAKNVNIGLPITRLYTMPLSHIADLTKASLPWDLLFLEPQNSVDVESMVAEIREKLSSLVYLDDGAFDEFKIPVYIETGKPQNHEDVRAAAQTGQDLKTITGGVNCSGFVKWIADGIVRPRVGSGIKIDSLKHKTSSPETLFTEPYRVQRDLFFGLDWIRNLASAIVSSDIKKTLTPDVSGVDITINVLPEGAGYKKDVGYKVEELLPLLYYLAVHEPGHIYFGALSRERGDPLLRQYHHVAAFFPWIDATAQFRLVIFESAVETDSDIFIERNKDAWIYLVRLRAAEAGYFFP